MISLLTVCILAYIVGSVPSGLILGKLIWNTDLREHGSCNIGATNAWRTIGKVAGFVIFLCDFLKGVFGVFVAQQLEASPMLMVLGGIFAIIGHSCSLFLKFKGGKGVATGLGVIIMLMPVPAVVVFVIWLLTVKLSGYVSLASVIAAACVPIFAWLLNLPQEIFYFGLLAAIFITVRHKANIARLLNGTEPKIKAAR